jgi:hypothetical protein
MHMLCQDWGRKPDIPKSSSMIKRLRYTRRYNTFITCNLSSLFALACVQDLHAWWSNKGRCELLQHVCMNSKQVKSHCRILTRENQFWGDWQVLLHLNVCTNICLPSHFSNIDRCQHMLDFPWTDVLSYELSKLLICRLYGYEPLLLVLVANHFNTLFYISLLLYKRELVVNARWCHTPPFLTSPIQGTQLLLLANIRYKRLCPITSR